MGHTPIEDSDAGRRAMVHGISLEGYVHRGDTGTIEGVSQDHFADAIAIKLDSTGKTEHFRQENVSGTGMY